MTDRIADADVRGPRTPHGPGAGWPTRAHRRLRERVSEAGVGRRLRSACVPCGNGCDRNRDYGCDHGIVRRRRKPRTP